MLATELPTWFVRVFAFAFGAVWGSFANVVIYRWPREMSVLRPGSHCVHCGKPVRAYDNVPILAWLWLRGRCRDCGTRISPRYVVVELLFAWVSVAIAERVFSVTELEAHWALLHYAVRFTVAFVLLVATFIDLDEMVVPWFVKWFAVVPLAGAAFLPAVPPSVDVVSAIAGSALGYLGLRALFIDGYKLLTGRPGMGLGDAEILLLIGALLGPAGVLFSLGAGAVQGVIATGVAMLFHTRLGPAHADLVEDEPTPQNDTPHTPPPDENQPHSPNTHTAAVTEETPRTAKLKVPFVPFLSLAALEYLLGADVMVREYLQWIRGE